MHRVDRYLELVAAAGASNLLRTFPLPPGKPEGTLPEGPFVLACPLAGWGSKQWPLEHYTELARRLKLPLVVNGPPDAFDVLRQIDGAHVHLSGLEGLIDATRRAQAIVGVDSGPVHLAAALGKPGVAIYGPTDPASHGPYGGTLHVLRSSTAITSYKRRAADPGSMRAVSVGRSAGGAGNVSRVSFPKPYADAVAKLRVPGGFLMVAAFLWLSAPTWTSLAWGLPVSALGLALRAWAAGHLEKNRSLAESGPYAYVRNPLYIGTLDRGGGIRHRFAALGAGSALRGSVPVDLPCP